MKILQSFFSIKNSNHHKVITILGIKIKLKNKLKVVENKLMTIEEELNKLNTIEEELNNLNYSNENVKNLCLDIIRKIYDIVYFNDRSLKGLPDFDKNFIEKFKNTNIQYLYIDLIKNLDQESIEIVNLILSRVQLWNNGIRRLPVTDRELLGLKKYACEFESNIVKLSDNCWAFNGYYLPENKFISTIFLDEHFIYKLKNLDKNKNIIDAGAYIGDSAIILSQYTNKNVYAFEPVTNIYNKINKTIELNSLSNVIPVQCGLGEKKETVEISLNDASSTCLSTSDENVTKELINIISIDDFVKEHNNLEIGLIKADIEGLELKMLKGAINTIKQQKPALLISIYHSFDDFFNIKKEIESWDLGYKFQIAKPDEYSFYCDTTLIAEVKI